ncbi:MAG TPA: antibiotic biosynthesis monooxygenase [Anaerolineaceae bacterium]
MLIVIVNVHVKPGFEEAFKQASIQNAENSLKEPGIARFNVIQQTADPARFALIEIYREPDAIARHKETAHYKAWKEAVEPIMAEPRTRGEFSPVFLPAEDWK